MPRREKRGVHRAVLEDSRAFLRYQGMSRVVPEQCQGGKGVQTAFLSIANAYSVLTLGVSRMGARLPSGFGHFVPGQCRHGVGFGRVIQASASPPAVALSVLELI